MSSSRSGAPHAQRRRVAVALFVLLLCGVLVAPAAAQTDQCDQYNRVGDACNVQRVCTSCISTSVRHLVLSSLSLCVACCCLQ